MSVGNEATLSAGRRAGRGVRGGGLVLLGSGGALLLQIVALVVFSRTLDPEDFGLVAMVNVFAILGNLLRDFGLPMAGLQTKTLSSQQASNLFWMNAAVAAVAAAGLAASSPALVALYDEPRLQWIVPAFAAVVLIGGISSQFQVNLARRMRFGVLVLSDLATQTMALAIAIVMAISGAGYWALVLQAVLAALATLVFRWLGCGWSPSRFRRGHGSIELFKVGAYYGFAQLLTFVQGNIDTVVIGARLGPAPLGYYNRAYQILTAPAGRLLDPLTQVVIPTLHNTASGDVGRERLLLRIQFGLGALVIWAFATMGALATLIVPLVLGSSWAPVVPILQVLAIGGCIWVFNHVSYWMFIVNERPRDLLRYNLVSKPFAITSILVGSTFGVTGVAWAYVIAMAFSWPLNLIWLSRTAGVRGRLFGVNGSMLLIAGAMCALAGHLAVRWMDDANRLLAVMVGLVASAAAMLLGVSLFAPTRAQLVASFRFAWTRADRRRNGAAHASN